MDDVQVARVIAGLLRTARLRASNERALQDSIEEALTAAQIAFQREKALSRRDRPDFLAAVGAVVLEVKLKCARKTIYRQLERYAEHDSVRALILVTGTTMGMPEHINGKPIFLVPVGLGAIGC